MASSSFSSELGHSDSEIESFCDRAPCPPIGARLTSVKDWGATRALVPGQPISDEDSAWWYRTPWYRKYKKAITIFAPNRKTSEVWQYFRHIIRISDGKPSIQCTRCDSSLTHPTIANTGTSALKRHLQSGHCAQRAKISNKGPIERLFDNLEKQSAQRLSKDILFSTEAFREQTLRMVASLNLSFRALDSPELQTWVQMIQDAPKDIPISLLPSRKLVPALENLVIDGRARLLAQIPSQGKIAIAVDTWTSPNHLCFLAITGYETSLFVCYIYCYVMFLIDTIRYFIDAAWIYHEILLGFEHIEGSHSGRHLALIIRSCLDDNSIQMSRIISLTCDNASNNKTLHNELVKAIEMVDTPLHLGLCARLPCLSHVIQLACNEVLIGMKINARNEAIIRVWHENNAEREQHTEVTIGDGAPETLRKVIFSNTKYVTSIVTVY